MFLYHEIEKENGKTMLPNTKAIANHRISSHISKVGCNIELITQIYCTY